MELGANADRTLDTPLLERCQYGGNRSCNTDHKAGIEMRQIKYLNNIVEQDHRAIKRQVRPMLGFKSFWSAAVTLAGVELMHMIRKGRLLLRGELCSPQQFYSLTE
jgi:putative transposase